MHRKWILRLLYGDLGRKPQRKQRGGHMARHLERHGEVELTSAFGVISVASMRRILQRSGQNDRPDRLPGTTLPSTQPALVRRPHAADCLG
jgi:hypothetical protein